MLFFCKRSSLTHSDRSSDQTHEQSSARQSLTFSPQSKTSHSQRKREPDSSHYTQSSGYQSQLSDNQTGINAGNQMAFTGSLNDNRQSQTKSHSVVNRDNFGENQIKSDFQENNLYKDDDDQLLSRNAHEEYILHKSVESRRKENQSSSFDENFVSHMHPRDRIKGENINPPSSPNKTHKSHSESPSTKQTVVIKHTTISMYPDNLSEDHKPDMREKTEVYVDKTSGVKEQVEIDTVNSVNKDDYIKVGTSVDLEQECIFEHKMRSFLEDFDMDYDDSIWEEKPDRTQSISGVSGHCLFVETVQFHDTFPHNPEF